MKPRALAAACALAVGLCGLPAPAATTEATEATEASRADALRKVQWERALEFLRARGDKFVPNSPYDTTLKLPFPDVKAQVEHGKLAPPTNDQLLEQLMAKTYRQMLGGGGCCPCVAAASCNNGFFCDGAEVCVANNCALGPAACNDGNPCTNDACTENTDTCSFTPVAPPPAVAQLNLSRTGLPATVAVLNWSAVGGASSYNVYRGTLRNLSNLTCFQKGVTGTSQNDDGAIPASTFYYLISSQACFESGLGSGNPNPRPPAPGCP